MLPVLSLWQNRAMTANPLRRIVAMLALALCASPVAAQPYHPYHPYDPGRGFETMLGVIITNALRPPYRPPLLPYYAPQPYVPGPVTGALPAPPQQRPHSREQWKQAIIEEGQKFCDTYPNDRICRFQDDRR